MAAIMHQELSAALAQIVSPGNVIPPEKARVQYANDQWWYAIAATAAEQPVSQPDIAVRPDTPEQVAEVVKLANHLGVPVTPWGGGSGVQGAANADKGGIVLDL